MGKRQDVSYMSRVMDESGKADIRRPDTGLVTVEIGLGICVDMLLPEATSFTRTKIASLQK